MFYKVVIFGLLFNAGQALVCYECDEGSNPDCMKKQEEKECKGLEDGCYTAFYNTKPDSSGSVVHRLWKGCTELGKCGTKQCNFYLKRGYECKVDCCNGNNCNKHGFSNKRQKRQHNNSGNFKIFEWRLLLLCSSMVIYVFKSLRE